MDLRRAAFLSCATLLLACGGPRTTVRMTTAGHPAEPVAEATATPEEQTPRAWLWEVSGGDAAAPSYLLGTMHIGVRMNVALPAPLDAHLYDARALVMEVDYREVDRFMTSAPRARPVPRRQWLDRALARPTWERLVAELGDRMPPDILRQLPPAMIGMHLSQVRMAEVEAIEEGREPVRGAASSARLDPSIFDWAIRRGTPIVALETSEEAFTALASVDGGDALTALTELVDEAEHAREEQRRLRDAYLAFDGPPLLALLASESTPEWREAVLLGRNRAWMPRLLPEIIAGNAFVAVGVGHLLGDGSVIEALTAAGYTVRRVGAGL
jgi:uncharacterized protein